MIDPEEEVPLDANMEKLDKGPESQSKDAVSVPSTDDESAYMDEQGVEMDELATLVAENAVPIEPVLVTSNSKHEKKKRKKLSFHLFTNKFKKKSSKKTTQVVAPPSSWPIPAMVETKSNDAVSEISSVKTVDKPQSESLKTKDKSLPEPAETYEKLDSTPPPHPVTMSPPKPSSPAEDEDGSVVDSAIGIGRKWALFFHREKGEVENDDDSSQGSDEDLFHRAIPASDHSSPSEVVRFSSSGNSHIAPMVDNINAFTPEQDTSVKVTEEPAKTTSTDGSLKRKWRPFSKAYEAAPTEEPEVTFRAIPASDLHLSEAAAFVASGNFHIAIAPQNSVPEQVSSAEEASVAVSDVTSGSDMPKEDKPSEGGGLFSPWNATVAALRSIAVDNKPGFEVAALEEDDHAKTSTDEDRLTETDEEPTTSSHIADASESGGFFTPWNATLAALLGSISVHDTGSVEVSIRKNDVLPATVEDSRSMTHDIEALTDTEIVSIKSAGSSNAPEQETFEETDRVSMKSNSNKNAKSLSTAKIPEDIASAKDEGEPAMRSLPTDVPNKVSFTAGIIAQRTMHLASLADNIPVHGKSSVDVSVPSASIKAEKKAPKSNFKAKLSGISSKETESRRENGVDSGVSSSKSDIHLKLADDKYAVDEEKLEEEMNAFFEQLDDETDDESVLERELGEEVSALTFSESSLCFQRNRRPYTPTSDDEFDEQQFERNFETTVCGATPSACIYLNVRKKAESKVDALLEAFDVVAACGRPVDNAKDILSTMARSGDEDTLDPSQLLDLFDEASLDDSFWSTLDESTVQTASVLSSGSSVRRFKKLLSERSLRQLSIENSMKGPEKATTIDDDSDLDDSIFESLGGDAEESKHGGHNSPDNATASSNKKDAVPANGRKGQSVLGASEKDVVPASDSKKDVTKRSPDQAVEDIRRAMATLKKHSVRHGISEAELLWKIQEEHKKRKGWNESMAEF